MPDLLLANGLETGLNTSTLVNSEFDAVSVVAGGTFAGSTTSRGAGSQYSLNTATAGTSGVAYGEWDWGSNEATIYAFLLQRFAAVPSAVTYFASIYDSTPAVIGDLGVNASGNWIFLNAGDATTYTSTGQVVRAGEWYAIELKLFSDASAGTIDWKTNHVLEPGISGLTGKNTKPGGFPRRVRGGVTVAQANAGSRFLDDVIVRNGGWVGQGFIRALNPAGIDLENWTTVDAGKAGWNTQYERAWASATTDMVKSSTASQEERWTLAQLGSTASGLAILGLVPMLRQRRGVAGSAAGVLANIRSGASDGTQSGSLDSGNASFKTFRGVIQETDPATSAAWTLAGVNAAKLRLVHDGGTNECDVNASLVYVAFTLANGNQNPSGSAGIRVGPSLETYRRRGRQKHRVNYY